MNDAFRVLKECTPKIKLWAHRYIDYSLETLLKCLSAIRNREISQKDVLKKFKILRNTIKNKLKNHLRESCERPPIFSKEEVSLAAHVEEMSEFSFPITSLELCHIIKSYVVELQRSIPQFTDNLPGHIGCVNFYNVDQS